MAPYENTRNKKKQIFRFPFDVGHLIYQAILHDGSRSRDWAGMMANRQTRAEMQDAFRHHIVKRLRALPLPPVPIPVALMNPLQVMAPQFYTTIVLLGKPPHEIKTYEEATHLNFRLDCVLKKETGGPVNWWHSVAASSIEGALDRLLSIRYVQSLTVNIGNITILGENPVEPAERNRVRARICIILRRKLRWKIRADNLPELEYTIHTNRITTDALLHSAQYPEPTSAADQVAMFEGIYLRSWEIDVNVANGRIVWQRRSTVVASKVRKFRAPRAAPAGPIKRKRRRRTDPWTPKKKKKKTS